jgi:F-type H+-transporting ATPase subunit delta
VSDVSNIADRWARALFELGVEQNQLEPLRSQIGAAAAAYQASHELRSVLDNPLVDEAKRQEILKALGVRLGMTQLALNGLRLLAQRRRLFALPEVSKRLAQLADERAGVLRATVTAAGPLPDGFYDKLTQRLEQLTKKKVVLDKRQDPSLLGGVITKIGDHTIDGSLRGRLQRLERQVARS